MRNTPDIIATVKLLETGVGGRRGPTPGDKFHCVMVIDDHNFDVRLQLDRVGPLSPGQQAVVPISFLDLEHAKMFVIEGVHFKLRELKVIGEGTINELLYLH
jgi:hypothetical protein